MSSDATVPPGDRYFVIATGNSGKRREFEQLLSDFTQPDWELYDRNSFPETLADIEETAGTFVGNAIDKATKTARQTGCCCLADDSGLEVDALDGAPGVHSARFAGEEATDEDNNRLLLSKLDGVPEAERTARFVAVVALVLPRNRVGRVILARRGQTHDDIEPGAARKEATPVATDDGVVVWFRGTVEGRITTEPSGDQGFGYDPLFEVVSKQRTMAELSEAEKNELSHRAEAVRKLRASML